MSLGEPIDECDISSNLKEVLKEEGYDTIDKLYCEPILLLLSNNRITDYWCEILYLLGKMSNSKSPEYSLYTKIENTPLSRELIGILNDAGYIIISHIWHEDIYKLKSISGMTDKLFEEVTSFMKKINLELK